MLFRWLFRIIRPTQLYVINWYTFYPAIVAAKQLKIQVHEIQHGVIHKEHPGYNVHPQIPIRYYPDQFHLWDKSFVTTISGDKNFQIIGFPLAKTEDIPGVLQNLLIISQASISKNTGTSPKIKPFLSPMPRSSLEYTPKKWEGNNCITRKRVSVIPKTNCLTKYWFAFQMCWGYFLQVFKAEQLQKRYF